MKGFSVRNLHTQKNNRLPNHHPSGITDPDNKKTLFNYLENGGNLFI